MVDEISKDPLFLYIADIIKGDVNRAEGEFGQYYVITSNGEQVSKIRLTGTIVKKFHSAGKEDKQDYTILSIDDGTGVVIVKAWGAEAVGLNEFEVGDEVDLIGRPRKDDVEMYLIVDKITKITNPMRALYLRSKKLQRYTTKNFKVTIELPREEEEELTEAKNIIFDLIAQSDEGSHFEEIMNKSGFPRDVVEKCIRELLDKGDIYEPHNLTYRII